MVEIMMVGSLIVRSMIFESVIVKSTMVEYKIWSVQTVYESDKHEGISHNCTLQQLGRR